MACVPRRLRVAMLQHQLQQIRRNLHEVLLLIAAHEAEVEEEDDQQQVRKRRRPRRWWVREWISRRPLFGQYENLLRELEAEHLTDFKGFLRMEPDMFYELLERVGPHIEKSSK